MPTTFLAGKGDVARHLEDHVLSSHTTEATYDSRVRDRPRDLVESYPLNKKKCCESMCHSELLASGMLYLKL